MAETAIDILTIVAELALSLLALLTLSYFLSSIWEREKRASIFAGVMFHIMVVALGLFHQFSSIGFFRSGPGLLVLIIGLFAGIVFAVLLFSRIGANPKALEGSRGLIVGDVKRVDERDTIFSRLAKERMETTGTGPQAGESLVGGPVIESGAGPEDDSDTRAGIDGVGGRPNLAMAGASDTYCVRLATPEMISPAVSPEKIEISPEEATARIKGFARDLGAVLVGVTEINPNWIYSHRGKSGLRRNEWGREISLDHKFAIVFAVEMDPALVDASPHTPVILATMINYAECAFIAAHLAQFIANLGYSARANQMAHYDAMMVPLAVDAGLGELSRMGYLITKEYGPRVRLGAVTTDLPLVPDKPVDIGVVDFCSQCLKCARCCPTNSIQMDDRREVNGSIRWTIETDSCHEYWRKLGTDCGICMKVCPWSHARRFPHRVITEAVTRSAVSRTLFTWMDDLFYGKRPPTKAPPEWARFD